VFTPSSSLVGIESRERTGISHKQDIVFCGLAVSSILSAESVQVNGTNKSKCNQYILMEMEIK
jgi:hypothetical protein